MPEGSPTSQPPHNPAPSDQNPGFKRRLKNRAKRGLRQLFEIGQRLGFNVLPTHFYSEIPDIRALRSHNDWKLPHTLAGVRGTDIAGQFEFLEFCCPPDRAKSLLTADVHRRACDANGEPGYGPIDADFLYSFIQTVRPQKVVQVGCGVSTAIILDAAARIEGYRPEVVCVEPFPTDFLKKADKAGSIRLVPQMAQSVAIETLTGLGDSGFLFVDSTHTVKPGSEVNRLILEVLPRLSPGTWVHFHDIYFPYDYQRGVLDDELFFCNETALLYAFLINNPAFTIKTSLAMLHYANPTRLATSLPNYKPATNDHGLRTSPGHFPSAIYLNVINKQ